MIFRRTCLVFGLAMWMMGISNKVALAELDEPIDYLRDVKPILQDRCFACHGPIQQESGLRLDSGMLIHRGGDSGPAIHAGKPDESLLLERVMSQDDSDRMPPEGEPLTEDQIEQLRRWVLQGAESPENEKPERDPRNHWAFQTPQRPPLPQVNLTTWGRQAIDRFVLARLEEQNVLPSPPAERLTLLRRLSLDLLGMPPTRQQIAQVEIDSSPDWYERLVEQFLASPHFGERWGKHWLDLARFADSDGHSGERVRPHAWRYRDWVIEAVNQDLPFDQFTIQQLAGDLLPDGGIAEKTAVGFHRQALTSRETCVDDEEKHVRVVVDRTITTGEVWLGLTVACCQCHTHKYDPLTHREFFGFYAFFDNLEDVELTTELSGEETEGSGEKAVVVPSLQERSARRATHVHRRGDFRQPGELVEPHTFQVLPPLHPRGDQADRLDLARWIVDRRNPLTARVAVNHIWKHLFGQGLVTTVNDFGTRGEVPSHPELLDWLAVDLMDRNWSRKELIRAIVLSETYRQSSAHRAELATLDPENRWLARQNRFRLEGEIIRDVSLAVAGMLDSSIGGPSFRPPVPPESGHGVFAEWKPQETRELGRRGLYVLTQRTVPHPVLASLDVPDGNVPCLQRTRANTPIQALTMMNDPMFFQAAQGLARRIMYRPATLSDRIRGLFELAVGRQPSLLEQRQMEVLLETAIEQFQKSPDIARAWSGIGISASEEDGSTHAAPGKTPGENRPLASEETDPVSLAAWVVLAQTMLNLDEFVTRE